MKKIVLSLLLLINGTFAQNENISHERLWEILKYEVPLKINSHNGLIFFIKNRAKFEGWFKVELCDILSKYTNNITPEKNRIDIVFDNWALELKTLNTNYRYINIENKIRPITKNIRDVLNDISSLKINNFYKNRAVVFIVFPLSLEKHKKKWERHIAKIRVELTELKEKEFQFDNGSSAVLYCGFI
jgi:hypothetical protein